MLTAPADSPLELLRELLADDKAAGVPWEAEMFVQRAWLACGETHNRSWLWPLVETIGAWRRAYLGDNDGALEHFEVRALLG